MNKKKNARVYGFTIVEVLIVLAIAGLILLIVFLIVPQLNRSQRNYSRKRFVDFVAAQFETYKAEHGKYPTDGVSSSDDRCAFIKQYLRTSGTTVCTPPITGLVGGEAWDCIKGTTELYTVCFHTRDSSHNYVGPIDEISIETGHFCTDTPLTAPNMYIQSFGPTDSDPNKYVVWTLLENAPAYCVDNNYKT